MSSDFGFRFWLLWICQFAGSFLAAAIFWTFLLVRLFGKIAEPEIVTAWSVAVFGSWFILLTPFMRKKEQIWKRLNVDQEKSVDAFLQGISLFIGLLVLSSLGWSFVYKSRIFSYHHGFDPAWSSAVIGTWLFSMLPFLVFLYKKADQIFKNAALRQTDPAPRFRSIFVERQKRFIPEEIAAGLAKIPPALENGHVVTLTLKDGRKIPNVVVVNSREILGVYDRSELGFEMQDVTNIEPLETLPVYEEEKWLRLDGRI